MPKKQEKTYTVRIQFGEYGAGIYQEHVSFHSVDTILYAFVESVMKVTSHTRVVAGALLDDLQELARIELVSKGVRLQIWTW